jgi:nitrogen fixation protein
MLPGKPPQKSLCLCGIVCSRLIEQHLAKPNRNVLTELGLLELTYAKPHRIAIVHRVVETVLVQIRPIDVTQRIRRNETAKLRIVVPVPEVEEPSLQVKRPSMVAGAIAEVAAGRELRDLRSLVAEDRDALAR